MKKIIPKALLGVVSFVLGIIATIKVFLAIVVKLDCVEDLKGLIAGMISNALYGAPQRHYIKYTRRTRPYVPYNPPKWDGSKYADYYRGTTVKEDFDDEEETNKKLKEQIIKLYHQGKSVSQISDILHIAEAMVVRAVSPHY